MKDQTENKCRARVSTLAFVKHRVMHEVLFWLVELLLSSRVLVGKLIHFATRGCSYLIQFSFFVSNIHCLQCYEIATWIEAMIPRVDKQLHAPCACQKLSVQSLIVLYMLLLPSIGERALTGNYQRAWQFALRRTPIRLSSFLSADFLRLSISSLLQAKILLHVVRRDSHHHSPLEL